MIPRKASLDVLSTGPVATSALAVDRVPPRQPPARARRSTDPTPTSSPWTTSSSGGASDDSLGIVRHGDQSGAVAPPGVNLLGQCPKPLQYSLDGIVRQALPTLAHQVDPRLEEAQGRLMARQLQPTTWGNTSLSPNSQHRSVSWHLVKERRRCFDCAKGLESSGPNCGEMREVREEEGR